MTGPLSPDMTSAEWAEKLACEHVDYFKRHPKGQISQVCIIEAEEGYIFVACAWRDEDERRFVLATLRAQMRAAGARRYAFFGEAWTRRTSVPPGRPLRGDDGFVMPVDDPNRGEEVFTIVVDPRVASPAFISHRIVRGRSGGVRTLVREPERYSHHLGALVHLLAPAKVAKADVQ